MALTGYRMQENLVHGRFLYGDDLVTDVAVAESRFCADALAGLSLRAAHLRPG